LRINVQVLFVIQHPDFNATSLDSDLVILKLKGKQKLSDLIDPIQDFASSSTDLENAECFVTGWGRTIAGMISIFIHLCLAQMHIPPSAIEISRSHARANIQQC